jgi:hypothetical protein
MSRRFHKPQNFKSLELDRERSGNGRSGILVPFPKRCINAKSFVARSHRLLSIKELISEGRYLVDSTEVANALVNHSK